MIRSITIDTMEPFRLFGRTGDLEEWEDADQFAAEFWALLEVCLYQSQYEALLAEAASRAQRLWPGDFPAPG